MPSPFPGMDPFVESQEWEDFHTTAITVMRELLMPRLGTRYTARVERRVYVERDAPDDSSGNHRRHVEPDVTVVRERSDGTTAAVATDAETATMTECDLPQPDVHREAYLTIRRLEDHEIVTIVELLSPTNKRPGADGRVEYLRKRDEILESEAHLVELDLLRGGVRMPMRPRAPVTGEYVALVSRSERRPKAELIAWPLRFRLPTISIPLAKGDADVPLDLQTVLDTVYDRARYDRTLNYAAPLVPPADAETQRWTNELLAARFPKASAE